MMQNQLTFTQQLQRIVALRYNHIFQKEIDLLREKYGIPKELTKALEWLKQYEKLEYEEFINNMRTPLDSEKVLKDLNANEISLSDKDDDISYWQSVFDKRYEISSWQSPSNIQYTSRKERIMIYKDENSKEESQYTLDEDMRKLITRFGIPAYMEFFIKRYLISNNTEWLSPDLLKPYVMLDITIKKGIPQLHIQIFGLYPWNTRKQWNEIWDQEIITSLREAMNDEEHFNNWESARKRRTLTSLAKQIKRDAEWYKIVEIDNLPLKTALYKWIYEHPEDTNIDDSTVSKAVSSFRDIITPITENS